MDFFPGKRLKHWEGFVAVHAKAGQFELMNVGILGWPEGPEKARFGFAIDHLP
jgi:hypothetical protein